MARMAYVVGGALVLLSAVDADDCARVTTLFGGGASGTVSGPLHWPSGITYDALLSSLLIADQNNHAIKLLPLADADDGEAQTLAGGKSEGLVDGTGTMAKLHFPFGLALDAASGTVYVADTINHAIRKTLSDGTTTTLAGGSKAGSKDARGTAALFNYPRGVAVDASGAASSTLTVLVVDQNNCRLRAITPNGTVTTRAGGGANGTAAGHADGQGTNALFFVPHGITIDPLSGTSYVADTGNNMLRAVTRDGLVTTLAGGGHKGGEVGAANGLGTAALFFNPVGLCLDGTKRLLVADQNNHKIRSVAIDTGVVTTFVGGGPTGTVGGSSNGLGTGALFNTPMGITSDPLTGTVWIADGANHKLREVRSSSCRAPGETCTDDAACAAPGVCLSGVCCNAAAARSGCSGCALQSGSCLMHAPGEACTAASDCSSGACHGGCCCSVTAALAAASTGCDTCTCWSRASTTVTSAGACAEFGEEEEVEVEARGGAQARVRSV